MTDTTKPGYFAVGESPKKPGLTFKSLADAMRYQRRVREELCRQQRTAFVSVAEMLAHVPLVEDKQS